MKKKMNSMKRNAKSLGMQLGKLKGNGKAPRQLKVAGLLKKESDSEGEDKTHAGNRIKTEDNGSDGVGIDHKVEDGVKTDHTGRKEIKTKGRKSSGIKIKLEED